MSGTGLRAHARDTSLLARAGDAHLTPPADEELAALAAEHLLDPAAGEAVGRPVAAECTYLRWKPGVSTTAAYRVRCEGGAEALVVAKRYGDGKASELADREERRAAEVSAEGWRPRAVLTERGLVLRVFPSDRELPGHQSLLDARRLSRLVGDAGLVPERSVRRRRTRATMLRYKPERRSVWRVDLRLRDADPDRRRFAARVLPVAAAERLRVMRTPGWAIDSTGVGPRLLAAVPRTGLLLEEWLDVETFGEDGLRHAAAAGALVARLHGAPTPPADEPADGAAARAGLERLFAAVPALWADAQRVPVPARRVDAWVHGDLHPDQLARLRDGGEWRLLDLDAAGPGDRTRELAGWAVDALRADPRAGLDAALAPFLGGYVEAGGAAPDAELLRAHAADLLVEGAAACFRRLQAGAEDEATRLVRAALDLVAGAR